MYVHKLAFCNHLKYWKMNTISFVENESGLEILLEVGIEARKNNKLWIASVPLLKAFGFSETNKDKALEDLRDTVFQFFKINIEDNTLEESLSNLGWKPQVIQNKSIESKFNYEGEIPSGLLQQNFKVPCLF